MRKQIITILTISTLAASFSHAAITAMTSAVFTAPVDNQVGLASFNAGATTYSDLTISTITLSGSKGRQSYWNGGEASGVGDPGDTLVSLNDDYITTGSFGGGLPGSTFSADFSLILNDGDSRLIYITEHIGNDNGIEVNPIVGGSVDSSWSLTLNGSDYGDLTTTSTFDFKDEGNAIAGTTFTIADFTGGTGTLTNVTGIQVTHEGKIDPSQIGVAAIPEPSTVALIIGLSALGVILVRRRS